MEKMTSTIWSLEHNIDSTFTVILLVYPHNQAYKYDQKLPSYFKPSEKKTETSSGMLKKIWADLNKCLTQFVLDFFSSLLI